MDLTLPQQLQEHIEFEMNCEAHCRSMSEIAPTEKERQVLLKIAENGRNHAQAFQAAYVAITGENYEPVVYPVKIDQPYLYAIRHLIMKEQKSFQEYHNQFMNTDNNMLKKVYYQVGLKKTEHISELMNLIIDQPYTEPDIISKKLI